MNYLSHAYRFLDDPLYAAGTVVPDWLSVVNRKVRAGKKRVQMHLEQPSITQKSRQVAQGILQHHSDDERFHGCPRFMQLEGSAAAAFRQFLPDKYDHRPGFLGHITVELLLDDFLANDRPGLLDRFYQVIAEADAQEIQDTVNAIASRTTDRLTWFIGRFLQEKFLYDYRTDSGLFLRLNQVLTRVRLPHMPDECLQSLAEVRLLLEPHWRELLDYVRLPQSSDS